MGRPKSLKRPVFLTYVYVMSPDLIGGPMQISASPCVFIEVAASAIFPQTAAIAVGSETPEIAHTRGVYQAHF